MVQIDLGDLQIHRGLMRRLVFGVKQAHGVGLIFGAQTGLLAGGRVLTVIDGGALKLDKPIFHVMPFGSES